MKMMKRQSIAAIAMAAVLFPASALSEPVTAGSALKRMSTDELTGYITGIVDGLAYVRHQNGEPDKMKCVLDWFYRSKNSMRQVFDAFERFPDHAPAAVMTALIKKQCGG